VSASLADLRHHFGVSEWAEAISRHRAAPIMARLLLRVRQEGECWTWTGSTNRDGGYGVIGGGGYVPGSRSLSRVVYVHRVAYSILVGDIPDGQQIDHLCRNRLCIRPDHLEAVPQRLNLDRGFGPWAVNKRKTHCKRGHEFTAENTSVSRKGERNCRTCKRLRRAGLLDATDGRVFENLAPVPVRSVRSA
jgi:hypothetical protein